MLDEVEAALDEANSRRYGDMITALAERSQLILITHNRETMSRAGILYGVTMGGGVGIACPCRYRVATERTVLAMPETTIGLFPDVGGSWFLSRAPGELGTYLAVTGEMIGPADAIYADLADVFVPGAELPALQAAMAAAATSEVERSSVG